MESMFVDKDTNIHVGQDAASALLQISDHEFLSQGQGIITVSKNRWNTAQTYERQTWMVKAGAHSTEDRNRDHLANFDNFRCLNGMVFNHAIELGCGPFTNLRYIMRSCRIQKCTLLDPLAEDYFQHRHCNYKDHFLRGDARPLFDKLSRTIVHRAFRRVIKRTAPNLLFATLPIQEIIAKPIEEMPIKGEYDLIVIINVIEHCYDARLIFDKIKSMASKDAILVFHDKYYYHDQVSRDVSRLYDAGHPLRVDRSVVDDFLDSTCTPIYRKIGRKESRVAGVDLGHDTLYFVGKLKA
jgi:hypothetical protein